ncbi:outer membrane beta-barrel protein [Terrarubrum flagellatum]|uniref:outer membrane beta-barrel protein n=1 Tax=Terrirubrum flagellatum TaxID=2895980 RepID=UPI0031453F38
MAGRIKPEHRGPSRPSRALGAVGLGCALLTWESVAFGQALDLPTILRPSAVTPEVIDGPDPARPRRAPRDPELLPRTKLAPPNPTRKRVRHLAPGAEASQRVQAAPLKRISAPALTPPPPPKPPKKIVENDPYAPAGIAFESFTIRPALDVDVGYDSNPNRLRSGVQGSDFIKPGAEVKIDSNWSTHSFQGLLRGSYSRYTDLQSANRPEAEAKGDWRFAVTRSTDVIAQGRFKLDTQSPQSTNLPFITSGRPLTYQYGGTLGAEHRINRFSFTLSGLADRYTFDDAKLPDGSIVTQGDRNYNQVGGTLRVGYEVTPGVRPFVEGKIDERLHDQRADSSGFLRNSKGLGGRVGTTIDIARTLVGEASVGYETRKYDDTRLADLRGVIGDASLIWSATPLTTLGLRAQTTLDETTTPGVSGAVTRKGTIEIAHAFLRNLTFTATGSFQRSEYDGSPLREDTLSGTVRLDYKLSRTIAVRASYTREHLKSSAPGSDYTANVFMVGLRLQR